MINEVNLPMIKRLLADAGIEQPSILSGRRTFAVRLKRHGVDTPTIHLMLGNDLRNHAKTDRDRYRMHGCDC